MYINQIYTEMKHTLVHVLLDCLVLKYSDLSNVIAIWCVEIYSSVIIDEIY